MLAVIAALIFFLAAILGWIDTTISVPHLLAIGFIAAMLLSFHLVSRVWWPDRRW